MKLNPAFVLALVSPLTAFAGQLILPGTSLERDRPVFAAYKIERQTTGTGTLDLQWSDSLGREVEHRKIPIELTDESEFHFPLDLRRAVAMQNHLKVHFSFKGVNKKGEADNREEDAATDFIARPAGDPWSDYNIIMWQDGSADWYKALETVGVNAGKSSEHSAAVPTALLEDNLPWYVENIATDFYSAYHIYRRDRPYNWALLQAKDLYKKDPSSMEALKRHPSFSDPQWLSKIHERVVQFANAQSPYRPLFYNLADESGIAELAGFWDFDFSDHALDAMRRWLKSRYGTLAALNAQWASKFSTWDLVIPDTTAQAMKRSDGNYSSWADHKAFMDISFAEALKTGANALHSVDPKALAGIEGAQMPGWGGYDYSRLSAVLDFMEPYDIGENIGIIRSLNPRVKYVTTSFATGPWEQQRVWHELLAGARGQIIWDDKLQVVKEDGSIGPRGKEVGPYWNELREGIAAVLMNSARRSSPIAIHYSQPSLRTEWMLANRPKGDAWTQRMSWTERRDSEFLRLRESYCRLIEDQGLQYNFVSYQQVEDGVLAGRGYRILILPRSSALSASEAAAITDFVKQGGTLIVDGDAGTFDEHSRQLPSSRLAGLLAGDTGRGHVIHMDALHYADARLSGGDDLRGEMASALATANVRPEFSALGVDGKSITGLEVHEFRNGGTTLIALHNNPAVDVEELGSPKFHPEPEFQNVRTVRLTAPAEMYAYNLRARKNLGRVAKLEVKVDPYQPTILAFSATPVPPLEVSAPESVQRGTIARVQLSFRGEPPAQHEVWHVEVRDPAGHVARQYSGNVIVASGAAEKPIPFALNDPAGVWELTVTHLLSGQQHSMKIAVN